MIVRYIRKYLKNTLMKLVILPNTRRILPQLIEELAIKSRVEIYCFNPDTNILRRVTRREHVWRILDGHVTDADHWVNRLENYCSDISIVFDVGANEGYVSAWFANWADSVYAFEPEPENFQRMLELHKIRSINNVIHEQLAVSDKVGDVDLFVKLKSGHHSLADVGASNTVGTVKVRTVKIDEYAEEHNIERISILKIDVEGFEIEVLKGAENLLINQKIDLVFFENSPLFYKQINIAPNCAIEYLEKLEYCVFDLNGLRISSNSEDIGQKDLLAIHSNNKNMLAKIR
jgi:FkbM family methyltransferase